MDVAPGFGARIPRQLHIPCGDREFLERYHAVATGRQHRAGHHFDAFLRSAEAQRRVPGGLGRLHTEAAAAGGGRLAGERYPVHRDAIEGGLVALGVDVLAQHRAGALPERQRLDRQALQVLPDQAICLGRREHSALLVGRLRLVDLDLLVEAVNDALQLVDRSVVFLRLHLLHVRLLLRLELIACLGD